MGTSIELPGENLDVVPPQPRQVLQQQLEAGAAPPDRAWSPRPSAMASSFGSIEVHRVSGDRWHSAELRHSPQDTRVRRIFHVRSVRRSPPAPSAVAVTRRIEFVDGNLPTEPTRAVERQAAKGVVANDDLELLLLRSRQGDYKFRGGGIEAGETPQQALVRELAEECGVTGVRIGEVLVRATERRPAREEGARVHAGQRLPPHKVPDCTVRRTQGLLRRSEWTATGWTFS